MEEQWEKSWYKGDGLFGFDGAGGWDLYWPHLL